MIESGAEPLSFYVLIDCPDCDFEIPYGPCVTLLEHKGLPLIPADIGALVSISCDECGAEIHTGELEVN